MLDLTENVLCLLTHKSSHPHCIPSSICFCCHELKGFHHEDGHSLPVFNLQSGCHGLCIIETLVDVLPCCIVNDPLYVLHLFRKLSAYYVDMSCKNKKKWTLQLDVLEYFFNGNECFNISSFIFCTVPFNQD